jgi:hypothetical protein
MHSQQKKRLANGRTAEFSCRSHLNQGSHSWQALPQQRYAKCESSSPCSPSTSVKLRLALAEAAMCGCYRRHVQVLTHPGEQT